MADNNNPFPDNQYEAFEFTRANMSNANFNGVDLTGASFWAVLKRAAFKDCNMDACLFDDVNLSGTSYENVNLSNATFNNINMSAVKFSNLNLANTEINDANLEGMKINNVLVSDLFAAYEKNSRESSR